MSHVGASFQYYGANWICTPSTFVAPAGSVITFTITYASAEFCCDRINVYDGSSTSSRQLGPLTSVGDAATSSSNYLTVVFTSDSSISDYYGFVASVSFSSSSLLPTGTPTRTPPPSRTPLASTLTVSVMLTFLGTSSSVFTSFVLSELAGFAANALGLSASAVSASLSLRNRQLQSAAATSVRLTVNARALADTLAFSGAGGDATTLTVLVQQQLSSQMVGSTAWCSSLPASNCRAPASVVSVPVTSAAGATASSGYLVGAIAGGASTGAVLLLCLCAGLYIIRRNRARRDAGASIATAPPPPRFEPQPVRPYFSPPVLTNPYALNYGPDSAPPFAIFNNAHYGDAPYGGPPPRPGLQLRRQESDDRIQQDPAAPVDPRPVDVHHEEEAVVLFGPWPAVCVICDEPLVAGNRLRIDAKGNAMCRRCGCAALQGNSVTPCDGVSVVLPDAVAELCEGSAHAAPGAPCLTAREVERIRDDIQRDAHENPDRWEAAKCPSCSRLLHIPAVLHRRGGPVVCHQCTHRVCTRCDAVYAAPVVPPQPGARPQTHEGLSCEAVARLRADGARISAGDQRALGIKGCPNCGTLVTHFRGHECHHMLPKSPQYPRGGCPGCGHNFCFASLRPWAECRDGGHQGHALYCDANCDCVDCSFCHPGAPCAQCS
jgi:hypothetical protein